MSAPEEVLDSPTGWVAEHVRAYVESDGATGHHHQGQDNLLLITRGRKSGKLRRTALIYGRDGERYLVVASNGGSNQHPLWYQNLLAQPSVQVQVGADVFAAVAREVAQVLELPLVEMSRYEPDGTATVIGAWSERRPRRRWPTTRPSSCAAAVTF